MKMETEVKGLARAYSEPGQSTELNCCFLVPKMVLLFCKKHSLLLRVHGKWSYS